MKSHYSAGNLVPIWYLKSQGAGGGWACAALHHPTASSFTMPLNSSIGIGGDLV